MALPDKFFKTDLIHRPIMREEATGFIGSGFVIKSGVSLEFEGFYDYSVVVYVINGTGQFIDWQGKVYPLKPGSAFFRDPRYYHRVLIDPGSDWVESFVAMQLVVSPQADKFSNEEVWHWMHQLPDGKDYIPHTLDMLGLYKAEQPVSYPGLRLDLVEAIDELTQKLKVVEQREVNFLYGKWISIFTQLRKEQPEVSGNRQHSVIRKVCDVVLNNPADRTSFPELLQGFGVSYPTLRKWFFDEMGCSLGDFRIRHRIDIACSMLVSCDKSIKEIAADLGYNDQFAFSKQFKKIIGVTPEVYRKSHIIAY